MEWMVDVARQCASYVLIVPFGVIYAKLMKARYGASLKLNVLFALLAYTAVFNGVYYALEQARVLIASKTPCVEPAMQRAYSTYNQELVLRQIGEHINAELKQKPNARMVSVDRDRFVMETSLSQNELPAHAHWHRVEALNLYCRSGNFGLARAIQVPLKLIVRNAGGDVVYQEQFGASGCAQ
jgi:hypothetical protein